MVVAGWIGCESATAQEKHFTVVYFEAEKARKAKRHEEALKGFLEVVAEAEKVEHPYWIFHAAHRVGMLLRDAGQSARACDYLRKAMEAGVDPTTRDVDRHLTNVRDRSDIVLTGLDLVKLLTDRGLLTEAFQAQRQLNDVVNRWVEKESGRPFDCLKDTPPRGLSGRPLAYVWRMRTSQAALWDLTAETLKAKQLLRKTLAENHPRPRGSREDREWQRTRLNLAVMLSFLGYERNALTVYSNIVNEKRNDANTIYARVNHARLSSKIEGPHEKWLEAFERGVAGARKLRLSERELSRFDSTLARMKHELGECDAAREQVEKLNDLAAARGDALIQLYARRQLLLQRESDQGDSEDQDFLDLLAEYRERGVRRGEPTVYRAYARHLARNHRFDEAIAIMRQAARLTESFGWHLHLPQHWIALAEWHQRLGQTEASRAVWKGIDQCLATHSDFSEKRLLEIELARVEWLASLGQTKEALHVYGDAKRFVRQSSLSDFQKTAFDVLDIEAVIASSQPSEKTMESPRGWADLQPLAVRSQAFPDAPAEAVYVLSNAGTLAVSGTLQLEGPIIDSQWDADSGRWLLDLEAGKRDRNLESPAFECLPGESVMVRLRHQASNEQELADLSLTWHADGKTVPLGNDVSTWEFGGFETDTVKVTAGTSNTVRRNAFYAVPVPQIIQWREEGPGRRNVRLKATAPCRLEVVDEAGELLAIDANGNGSHDDPGDLLIRDQDANGDLDVERPSDDSPRSTVLIYHAYPNAEISEPIELHLLLLSESGEWETASVSLLQ